VKDLRTLKRAAAFDAYNRRAIVSNITLASDPLPPSDHKEPMSTTDLASAGVDMQAPSPSHAELLIKQIAKRLKVGYRDMAAAGGIGVSTLAQIITLNQWPTRQRVRRDRILATLRERGATETELATAFDQVPEPEAAPAPEPTPAKGKHKAPANAGADDDTLQETDMLMGKQTLSMAARKAFSLFTNPFDGEVSTEADMFLSGEIRFIREACWQCATNGSFVALMGASGAGKTTILSDLKERIKESSRPVIMIEPSVLGMGANDRIAKMIKSADILAAGVATLDPQVAIKPTIEGRTRQLVKLLEDSVSAGNSHLLVIEEAHDLPEITLKHLKRLQERARIGRRSALGILLVAHPELKQVLNERRHSIREVFQRCEMLELQPLDHELGAYLAHKAKAAGRELRELITDDGIEAIRGRLTIERRVNNSQAVKVVSLVYPLAVQNVLTAALNEAAALGAPVVDADIVRAL